MNLAERIGYDGSAAGQKTGQKTFGSLMTKIVRQIGFVGKNPLEIRFELGFTESMVDDLETAYERGINTFRNRGTRPEGSQTAVPTEDLETVALDLYREWHRSGFSEPWERARAQELSNIVEELSERHARTPFDVARDLKGRAGVGDTPQITGRDKSKLPAVIDAASVAAEAARLGADESRPKGKGASFRGLGSLARSPIFKVARLVQEGYNLLPEDYKVIEDWVDRMKKTQTHELFGMDKPGIEYLKEWLGVEQTSPTESAADTPESRELRGKLFQELANNQRDAPELLMVEAQGVLGGGVLSHAIEHTGDLTHRIADKYDAFDGYGYDVGNKVDKVLRSLRSEYGFEKEFNENIRAASSYRGIPEKRLRDAATKALQKYADAHKSLRVYNEPQKWARDAAVALGEQRFTDAREHLSKLQNLIRGEGGPAQSGENISEAYRRAAGEFNPDFEDLKPERKASGGFVDKPLYDDARIGGMI